MGLILIDIYADHSWTNGPTQQRMFGVVKAYWTHHKPINFVFKIPNCAPYEHHIKLNNFFFLNLVVVMHIGAETLHD